MGKKNIKKALMAGVAAYGASKLMGAKEKALLASTEDGKSASSMITGGKNSNDYDMSNSIKKKGILSRILNMGPGKNATSSKGGTLANPILGAQKNNKGMRYDGMEMGIGGAKYGKMIKANNGVMVESRGNKLARSKTTKIC